MKKETAIVTPNPRGSELMNHNGIWNKDGNEEIDLKN
jgi:hypothetical protein